MFNFFRNRLKKQGQQEMGQISVSEIPAALLVDLVANGCTNPKQCFSNCAIAVLNHNIADAYVLCFVQRTGEKETGHAILKVAGQYFDPTLAPQGITNVTYFAHTEFSKRGLVDFVNHGNASSRNGSSELERFPPALLADGTIQCVAVDA